MELVKKLPNNNEYLVQLEVTSHIVVSVCAESEEDAKLIAVAALEEHTIDRSAHSSSSVKILKESSSIDPVDIMPLGHPPLQK